MQESDVRRMKALAGLDAFTIQTIDIIANGLQNGQTPLQAISEVEQGVWQGLTAEQILTRIPAALGETPTKEPEKLQVIHYVVFGVIIIYILIAQMYLAIARIMPLKLAALIFVGAIAFFGIAIPFCVLRGASVADNVIVALITAGFLLYVGGTTTCSHHFNSDRQQLNVALNKREKRTLVLAEQATMTTNEFNININGQRMRLNSADTGIQSTVCNV
ncbi:hypothetical protein Ddc_06804 [Ditylenchus destructor]|nr:hypothetical protein Ddc_06804 [Ditylenchus destructor]